ncbi:MAG: DUF4153 domain-containing protein [Gemmatimonadota bacterium]
MVQSLQQDKDDAFARRTAARVALAMALLLGLAAERLLWYGPLGLGWLLWIALFGACAVVIVRQAGFEWQRETAVAVAVATGAAAIPLLRAAPALHLLSLLVLVVAASVPLLRARSFRFVQMRVAAQIFGLVLVPAHALGGVFPLVVRDAGRAAVAARVVRVPLIAARAALLAAPPLVVFAALFMSADPVFESYAQNLVQLGFEDLLRHLAFALAFAWISAGLLRSLLPQRAPAEILPPLPTLPAAEVTIALGALALLFGSFVGVQARWLFNGAAALSAIPGLTVADYARRGFFELVVAAALVVPLLLAADAVTRNASVGARTAVRVASGTIVLLVFAVMISAFQRMMLYTGRFGLTELRVYTTAFMVWLAVVFAWYAVTTLRGRRRRLVAGPVTAGIIAVFTLAAVNPDALIARVNLERSRAGNELDSAHLGNLSADAVPYLLPALSQLDARAQCAVSKRLLKQYATAAPHFLADSPPRARARELVARHAERLTAMTRTCPVTTKPPAEAFSPMAQ